jgi:hypothetical protein
MRTDCPLVIIRWLDSAQPISAWRHLHDLPHTKPIECATVGWLLKDDDEVKVVCQSVGDLKSPKNAQASGIMTIPARCVLSVERLTEEGELISSADLTDLVALAGSAADPGGSADPIDSAGLETGSGRMQRELESLPA